MSAFTKRPAVTEKRRLQITNLLLNFNAKDISHSCSSGTRPQRNAAPVWDMPPYSALTVRCCPTPIRWMWNTRLRAHSLWSYLHCCSSSWFVRNIKNISLFMWLSSFQNFKSKSWICTVSPLNCFNTNQYSLLQKLTFNALVLLCTT